MLNAGDCGSWVVDQSTCQVYGHVVASDGMGDTYVVPLNATLQDMERKLGAAVCLPSEAYVLTWLAQHAKASAQEVTVPVRSKKKKVAFHDSKMDRAEPAEKLQRPAGYSQSQASVSPAPATIRTPAPIEDYCNSCNARFEGTSKDVRSNLLHHLQTCSRQNTDVAPKNESSPLQDAAKETLDEWSKTSSVSNAKKEQQKTTDNKSTQQIRPVPWSIRSMYSSFKEKSSSDSQQKAGGKGKSSSNSKDNKLGGAAPAKKTSAPASQASTAKDFKNDTEKSKSKKDSASPLTSKSPPVPSSALAGRISRDLPLAPPGSSAMREHRSSLPVATSKSSRMRQDRRVLTPPPSHQALPLVHGQKSVHGSSIDPPHLIHSRSSRHVSYEGYTFTKCDFKQTGQKETWAVARMTPMPVSQEDLKDHIKRNRKKHITALDEYNDEKMKGFKRKQVDNLIQECTKIDGDYGYEYELASIKLDARKTKSKLSETLSMQVILKRQLRADLPHELSTGPPMDLHANLPSQVMNLLIGDEPAKARDYGGGTQDVRHRSTNVAFASHPEHVPVPVFPTYGQFPSHGVQYADNRLPLFDAAPQPVSSLTSPAQGLRLPLQPHGFPLPPPSFSAMDQETQGTQGHLEVNDPKKKKKSAPKIVHIRSETRKKHDDLSNSDSLSDVSLELNSDHSWAKTDATPDTAFSGESREYRKKRKSHKESKDDSDNKVNLERTPQSYAKEGQVYRGFGRKEHRRSSLSPGRRSRDVPVDRIHPRQDLDLDSEHHGRRPTPLRYSYGTRYSDHGHYEVEPAISFPTNRAPHRRRSSVSPERPSHRRSMSYDLDRSIIHDSRALVPAPRPSDLYDREGWLAQEQERWERKRLRREMELERIERLEDRARARRTRELEMQERVEHYDRMERMRRERMRRENVERDESLRGSIYDDHYTPRRPRDMDYYQ